MAPQKKKTEEVVEKRAKRKADAGVTRDQRAEALAEAFNKRFKNKDGSYRARIQSADDVSCPYLTRRFPVGLLQLDTALRGGFPGGGVSQIIGPKNSGKSWLAWQVIRNLQAILGAKMKVLRAMTEMRADKSQARLAGVAIGYSDSDISSMERAQVQAGGSKFTKEDIANLKYQIGDIRELHGESAEDLYDGVLMDVEYGVSQVIIVDSWGAIMSAAEAESESLSEKQYGGAAAINSKFLRKLCALLTMDDEHGRARDVCIIGINHVRDDMKNPQGYRAPGGKALEHAKFVDLYVESGAKQWESDNMLTSTGNAKTFYYNAKEVNWRIEKGKAGIHEGAKGDYLYNLQEGQADFYRDTLVAGVRAGVVLRPNNVSWIVPDPEDPGSTLLQAQGFDNMIAALKEDARAKTAAGDYGNSMMSIIRSAVFAKEGIKIDYSFQD